MSRLDLKGYVFALRPQIVVICIVLILQILSLLNFIPAPSEILAFMINLLTTHGLPLVMAASFVENFGGLGTYLPGSIAIMSAMALTAGNPAKAIMTYFAIIVPALAANLLSYWIGYYNKAEDAEKFPIRSTKALLLWYGATYWNPQLASITAMASGSERIKFWRYFAHFLPVSFVWSVLWALFLYNTGKVAFVSTFLAPLFYVYIIGWTLWGIREHYYSQKIQIPHN